MAIGNNIDFIIVNDGINKLFELLNAGNSSAITEIKLGTGGTIGTTPLATETDLDTAVVLPGSTEIYTVKTAFDTLGVYATVDMTTFIGTDLNEVGLFFTDGTMFAIGYTITDNLPTGPFIQEFQFNFKMQPGLVGVIDFSDPLAHAVRIEVLEDETNTSDTPPDKVLYYDKPSRRFKEALPDHYVSATLDARGVVQLATAGERSNGSTNTEEVLSLGYLENGLASELIKQPFNIDTFNKNIFHGIVGNNYDVILSWTTNNIPTLSGSNLNGSPLSQSALDNQTVTKTSVTNTINYILNLFEAGNPNTGSINKEDTESLLLQFYHYKDEKIILQPGEYSIQLPSSFFHLATKMVVTMDLGFGDVPLSYEHSPTGDDLVNKFDVGHIISSNYVPVDISSTPNLSSSVTHLRVLDQSNIVNINNTGLEFTLSEIE